MRRTRKDVLSMYVRVYMKSFIKTNLALWSRIKGIRNGDHNNIYILMYHRVNNYRRNEMSVPVGKFSKQVAWLEQNGFRNMRMAELESLAPNAELKAPRVIFTFDDGYEDNYLEAYPILKKSGYTAIFYIPYKIIGSEELFPRDIRESNRPNHNRFMNWKQIRSMYRTGMEIGSHTLTHKNLIQMNDTQAKKEIVESKKMIEDKIGDKISSFCYPGGRFSEKHADWVAEAGYSSACSTKHGFFRGKNLFELPRIAVLASDNFFIFKHKILGDNSLFNLIH